MKFLSTHKNVIVHVVSLLYILLFVYAAISKLLDFENFRVQLGQSPLLSVYAGWVAWMVPFAELVIVLLLLFSRARLTGLFAAFGMMIMFTVYIYIILNYSDFVPCSCGGVLEKLGWTEHLIFNLFFVLLGLTGILFSAKNNIPKLLAGVSSVMVFSIGIVILLFVTSEYTLYHQNPFIRRFPNKVAIKQSEKDLKYNSFYLAGYAMGKIYLGNYTAPLRVTVLDTTLKNKGDYTIKIPERNVLTTAAQVRVLPPYFYLIDGNRSVILRGNLSDWEASLQWKGHLSFSDYQLVDSLNLVFRTIDQQNNRSVLGKLYFGNPSKVFLDTVLLEKQVDGIFDVDGTLNYDYITGQVAYTYRYRNQYIVADPGLKLKFRGNTIDTTSQAKLKVVYLEKGKKRKLAAPPWIVNRSAALWNDQLFVQSALIGRYEPREMWKEASIIDVYDLKDRTYRFSFYIYHMNSKKLQSFFVIDQRFFGFIGESLVCYTFLYDP